MTFAIGAPVSDNNAVPVTLAGDGTRVDYSATVTIPSGQSLSAAIDLAGHILSRIEFPDAWTTAALTFQVSNDGVTWRDLYDETGEVSFSSAGANHAIQLGGSYGWWTIRYLKIRSGTSAVPVAQTADRIINLYSGYRSA
jgi:hypothetical protein